MLDVRQRRGVRGSEYAWANAQRLEAALSEAGIGYSHLKELAPTTEMRQLQYAEDAGSARGNAPAPPSPRLTSALHRGGARPGRPRPGRQWIGKSSAALLCVERDPEACHRSLIAERLRREWGFEVEHLRPA